MNIEELKPWVEKLNAEPDKNKRVLIVADLCKEKNIKTSEAWKLLKEAGLDADPKKDQPVNGQPGGAQESAKEVVLASHKTDYEKYRCAGIVLTRKLENYSVTKEQYEKLKRDPWVELK
jgi:hypothetical protein